MNYKDLDREYIDNFNKNKDDFNKDYMEIMERVKVSKALFRNEDVEAFEKLGTEMLEIGDRVVEEYLKSENFRKKFGFPEELEELILIDNGYDINVPMCRLDIFYDDDKNFKFCELNTSGLIKPTVIKRIIIMPKYLEITFAIPLIKTPSFYNPFLFSWYL